VSSTHKRAPLPYAALIQAFAQDALGGDVANFSVAVGAFGCGGLLGAIALLGINPNSDRRLPSSWLAVAYGVCLTIAAMNPWLSVLPVVLVFAGLSMSISNTSANALLQSTAPARLRSRTVSLYMLAMRGGVSIGSLLTGFSVSLLGVREALLINGIIAVIAQAAIGARWRRSHLPKVAA
jgi:predicted MFS family arabinose efflux permease